MLWNKFLSSVTKWIAHYYAKRGHLRCISRCGRSSPPDLTGKLDDKRHWNKSRRHFNAIRGEFFSEMYSEVLCWNGCICTLLHTRTIHSDSIPMNKINGQFGGFVLLPTENGLIYSPGAYIVISYESVGVPVCDTAH